MDQHLPEILARVVGARAHDNSIFEIDPLEHFLLTELQQPSLPPDCQKLQQIGNTHGDKRALKRHRSGVALGKLRGH